MGTSLNVLIVGGNLGSVGIVDRIKEAHPSASIDVATISTDHPLAVADGHRVILYQSGGLHRVIDLRKYDFVLPGSHDLYLRDMVFALERQDLIASYTSLNDKRNLHQRLSSTKRHNIAMQHCSNYALLHQFLKSLDSDSLILKPIRDSGGGKGIEVFQASALLGSDLNRIDECLSSGDYILEQYAPGHDFAISLFIDEQGDTFEYYIDREYLDDFRVVGSISGSNILRWAKPIADQLHVVLQELGHNSGFFHCQIRLTSLNEWKIVEVTERLPGDVYWWPAEMLGISYRDKYIQCWARKFGYSWEFFEPTVSSDIAKTTNCYFGRCYRSALDDLGARFLKVEKSWCSSLSEKTNYYIDCFSTNGK